MAKASLKRGVYPNTSSLMNVLAAQGVTAPHTGKPFSEALLLGIGGGLGAGYILWEFQAHGSASIVMGFSNRWNYSVERLVKLCDRINAQPEVLETSGTKVAAANLQAALDEGLPVVVWVDKAHLPYQQLPESLKGTTVHMVGVHGEDGDSIIVDDVADRLQYVPKDIFASGRARIGSDKNRILRTTPPKAIDLEGAVKEGINDHVQHLERDSESFSLPVYKKWAKMFTDPKNKKGWPTVFKSRWGLYPTLRSIFEAVTLDGTDGAGLRNIYADFLDEAAGILNNPALKDAATAYREVAVKWQAFANAALAADIFAETRDLMQKRYQYLHEVKQDEMRPVSERLEVIMAEFNKDFPLDDKAIDELFADLQAHVEGVYDGEVAALNVLKATSIE